MSRSTLLCATDLGSSGDRALALAAAFARSTGAPLHVVHVCDLPQDSPWPMMQDSVRPAAEALRLRLRQRFEAASASLERRLEPLRAEGLELESSIEEGRPWEVILESAERVDAGLIVVGEHARAHGSGVDRLKERVLGSSADRVARHATIPVIVACGAIPETLEGARWLVGIDFSDESRVALREAARLTRRGGGEIHLVHTLPEPFRDKEPPADWASLVESMKAAAEEKMRALAAEVGCDPAQIHIVEGRPGEQLPLLAADLDVDVVVVGTRGHGRLA
ncbi:MAG: universal stress protein, partial [Myxococcales bacterium]|nr:universal stress protein [Myxococcales bacterium]